MSSLLSRSYRPVAGEHYVLDLFWISFPEDRDDGVKFRFATCDAHGLELRFQHDTALFFEAIVAVRGMVGQLCLRCPWLPRWYLPFRTLVIYGNDVYVTRTYSLLSFQITSWSPT